MLLETAKRSGNEVTRKMVELMLGAFTLVTALAWNEAVKRLFSAGGPLHIVGRMGPWLAAVIITAFLYLMTALLKRFLKPDEPPPCTTICKEKEDGPTASAAPSASSGAAAAAWSLIG